MTEFKKLKPIVVREESEIDDKEIWQPRWNCFCCHDTGIIRRHLTDQVIDNYTWDNHKLPLCQKPGCKKSGNYLNSKILSENIDSRFTATTCKKLDEDERENWKDTVVKKQENLLKKLAKEKSMNPDDKTQIENNETVEDNNTKKEENLDEFNF